MYIPEFVTDLAKKYDVEKLRLSFGRVAKSINDIETDLSDECINSTFMDDETYSECFLKLNKLSADLGFEPSMHYANDGFCIAKTKHSFVLHPDGKVYKCLRLFTII